MDYKDQRIGVFIDVQNMYYSAKNLYNAKVNFGEILKTAVGKRQLIRAIAYVIKADVGDEKQFFNALNSIGYEVKMKDLQVFFTGHKKGDWDVGIAMDIMRLAAKLDVIVLVTGDGDFKDLLEHVKALGCKAEVMAFGKTASAKLKEVADVFFDMDQEKSKYLIKSRTKNYKKQINKSEQNKSKSADKNKEKDHKKQEQKKVDSKQVKVEINPESDDILEMLKL